MEKFPRLVSQNDTAPVEAEKIPSLEEEIEKYKRAAEGHLLHAEELRRFMEERRRGKK